MNKKNNRMMLLVFLLYILLTGCGTTSNNEHINQVSEHTLSVEEQANKKIYDEALDFAYNGDFCSAVKKLNELSEVYLDSDDLIVLFAKDVESSFVGTWHCSRANSCNDMDITLKIYPVYRTGEIKLYYERDMKSSTGVGSSNITGTIDMPTSDSVTVFSLNSAKWTVTGSGLTEVFTGDGNKTNTYTK